VGPAYLLSTRRSIARRLRGFVLMTVLINAGCDISLPVPSSGERVRSTCPAVGDSEYFFPEGTLVPGDLQLDYERRISLSSYMASARTVSLSCGSGQDAYRFIWGGAYNDPLIVITIHEDSATYIEFVPFNIAERTIKQVRTTTHPPAKFKGLVSQLEQAKFWSTEAVRSFQSEGSGLILEGRRGKSYRAISRSHPEKEISNAGRLFAEIVGVAVPSSMSSRTR
jgi:hypothetical protein